MIFNLRNKVEEWVDSGLVTETQGKNILRHEGSQGKPWVIYGVTGIGVTAIAVGVISLVAANWMDLSDAVKLVSYFLLQLLIGWAAFSTAHKSGVWREVFLSLFSLLFFAGIGLVAQIYNLHSAPWRGLLFWCVLCLPIAHLARSKMLAHIWVITSLGASGSWAVENQSLTMGATRLSMLAAYPLFLVAISFAFERWKRSNPVFRSAILIWGVGVTVLAGSIFQNFFWISSSNVNGLRADSRFLPMAALVVAAAASWLRGPNVAKSQRATTAAMFLTLGFFYFFPIEMHPLSMSHQAGKVVGAIGFLGIFTLAAAAAAFANHRRLFDLVSLVIAIRMIVIYFEVFGSLTQTGVGLILSGVVVLAVAALWTKYRVGVAYWLGAKREK